MRQVERARTVFCVVFALALLASGIPLAADDGKDEILRFLDQTMPGQLTEYHVPGAAVAVVKDGAIAASRGYGTADLDLGSPVDPGRTLFRIASVTKLLTWTAVMQLVERGLVDLDEDVNSYLKSARVPAAFGAPVTMRQLMTHTAGFEDVGIGTLRYTPQAPGSLASYLSAHLPARVKPPGTSIMYSNHGAALAGLVVEEVSGMPFEQYVEREILAPLRMEHTSVLQPPPEALRSNLSKSYVRAGGSFRPTTYAVDLLGPAGGASATADDMAAFMLAHLQGGEARGARILKSGTVELMHASAFSYDPALPGWALGFQELRRGGSRFILHDGFFQGYVSLLFLAPEKGIGLFVAYNSAGGADALDALLEAFMDRFLPRSGPQTAAEISAAGPVPAGTYVPARRPYTTIEKLNRAVPVERISAGDLGSLMFLGRRWNPVRPGLFSDTTSDDLLRVLTDVRGRVTGVAVGGFAFDRLNFFQHPSLHIILALLCGAILLSAVAVWPIRAVLRRRRAQPGDGALRRVSRWIAGIGAALALASSAAIVAVLAGSPLASRVPESLAYLTLLPFAVAASAVASLTASVILWTRRRLGVMDRIHYSLVAAALAVMSLLMQAYGIMGPHLG